MIIGQKLAIKIGLLSVLLFGSFINALGSSGRNIYTNDISIFHDDLYRHRHPIQDSISSGQQVLIVNVDCNGDTNGTASIDQCGVCSGGNTGLTPNSTCIIDCPVSTGYFGYFVNEIIGFNLVDIPANSIIGGPFIGGGSHTIDKAVVDSFTLGAEVCMASELDSVRFSVNGSFFSADSSAPFTIMGDDSTGSVIPWDPPLGNYVITATPYRNNVAGFSSTYTFLVIMTPPPYCADTTVLNSCSGTFDDGSGPSTLYYDNTECYWLIDPPSSASVTLNFNYFSTESSEDFLYVYDGPSNAYPLLGTFSGDNLPGPITATSGKVFLKFTTDGVVRDTGWSVSYSCVQYITDCNGDTNGTASIDLCGVCSGGNTGLTPNASCSDCNGVVNGTAAIDDCGICAGGTTGITPNSSKDNCGVCFGNDTTYSYDSLWICQGDSIYLAGAWQVNPGIYVDHFLLGSGCDSAVETSLSIRPVYLTTDSLSLCDGDSVFLAGQWQNSAGTYYDSLKTRQGCDSIIGSVLSVLPVATVTTFSDICQGDSIYLANAWRFSGGLYIDSLTSINGCDSIIKNNLAVFQVDTAVIDSNGILVASARNAGYRWINCVTGQYISGDTNRIFNSQSFGLFACEVSQSGCVDTSECKMIAGGSDNSIENLPNYPNPTNGVVTFELEYEYNQVTVTVISPSGRQINDLNVTGRRQFDLDFSNLSSGIYYVYILADEQTKVVKVIRQ